ncbi:MAG: hypothetical protein JXR58_11690 [Bacteroidales bacterium]|nr:hypothetical protein [Bacteroidales bacterium]
MNEISEKEIINTNEVITDFEFTYLISKTTSTFDFLLDEQFVVVSVENNKEQETEVK